MPFRFFKPSLHHKLLKISIYPGYLGLYLIAQPCNELAGLDGPSHGLGLRAPLFPKRITPIE